MTEGLPRYAIVYGAPAGFLAIAIIILSLLIGGESPGPGGQWLGYLIMLAALSLLYVGVRRYRDRELGGVIGFGRAFALGALTTLAAGIVYVLVWEVYLAATDYRFMHDYAAAVLAQKEAAGASEAELAAARAQMEQIVATFSNPLLRLPLTLTEIQPVGLIVALVSAALLRTRPGRKPGRRAPA